MTSSLFYLPRIYPTRNFSKIYEELLHVTQEIVDTVNSELAEDLKSHFRVEDVQNDILDTQMGKHGRSQNGCNEGLSEWREPGTGLSWGGRVGMEHDPTALQMVSVSTLSPSTSLLRCMCLGDTAPISR